jgi:hypothetical protein
LPIPISPSTTAGGDVGASLGNAEVADLRGLDAAEPDVADDELGAERSREHADRRLAPGGGCRNLGPDLRRVDADATRRDAVVGGEHEDPGRRHADRRGSGRDRPALKQRLERTEAADRLDELVGGIADADARRRVAGHNRIGECVPPLASGHAAVRLSHGHVSRRNRRVGGRGGIPALVEDVARELVPAAPAGGLEPRPARALVRIADAQPRDRDDVWRDPEQLADVVLAVERHPSDPDPLGPGGEPQVLDRQAGAVEVGVGDRVAAEDLLARLAVAADADADGSLADPLELEVEVVPRTLVEMVGLDQPLAGDEPLHGRLRRLRADDDQPPRLTEADGRRHVRGRQQPGEQPIVERVSAETADVAATGDRLPHAGAGGLG